MVDRTLDQRLSDAQWLLGELREDLGRLSRSEDEAGPQHELSKGFLVYQILETRGMLRRLRAALLATAEREDVWQFLKDHTALEGEVEGALHAGGTGLMEELTTVLGATKFLRDLRDFVELARPQAGESVVSVEDGFADYAEDLFIGRDALQLVIDGAREVWSEAADDQLADAYAVLEDADLVMRRNFIALAPARAMLEQYSSRFNVLAGPGWWWREKLPAGPHVWARLVQACRGLGADVGAAIQAAGDYLMVLPAQGTELVRVAAGHLDDLVEAGRLQTAPLLAGGGQRDRPVTVALLNSEGKVLEWLLAEVTYRPTMEQGRLRLRATLPRESLSGALALVMVDLVEGSHLIAAGQVKGKLLEVDWPLGLKATYVVPDDKIEIAIISWSSGAREPDE